MKLDFFNGGTLLTVNVDERVDKDEHEKTGSILRGVRNRNAVNASRMAKMLGVSAQYLSDLELGRRNWNNELAEEYVRLLGVKIANRKK